jgi:hypothetical protein
MGILTDDQGRFHDPDCAASHAFFVEGRTAVSVAAEAARMIRAGGITAARARAWLRRRGLAESELGTATGRARVDVAAAETVGC